MTAEAATPATARRRLPWRVPEVVQTSAMDCGPAALKCLLQGFGVSVSYGRLREACQTDVDGTSIDTLEDVACQLGLEAEQVMVPADHLVWSSDRHLPALVVVRLPDGLTHFVVAWRRVGSWIQVMDPGTGRRWVRARRFVRDLYLHSHVVAGEDWREWAGSDDFVLPLRRRMARLGLAPEAVDALVDKATADASWRPLASLDAAVRAVQALLDARALRRGAEATRTTRLLFETARTATDPLRVLPSRTWCVIPHPRDPSKLILTGAVALRVSGIRAPTDAGSPTTTPTPTPLSRELAAALAEPPERPGRTLLGLLREDGLLAPAVLVGAMALAAALVTGEAVVLRSLLDLARDLPLPLPRLGLGLGLAVLLLTVVALELPLARGLLRAGRHLEMRLRLAFLARIPRLGDRYFLSRPVSDMVQRSHALLLVRLLPETGSRFLRAFFGLCFTVAGIAWLDPSLVLAAASTAALSIALPLALQPLLSEQDLRFRTHQGALSRFYLDALLGLVPVHTHGAAPALRREQERLLAEWVRAGLTFTRTSAAVEALLSIAGYATGALLLWLHLASAGEAGAVLLLVWWALRLPGLGLEVASAVRQYPALRSVTLRLLEPLGAPVDPLPESTPTTPTPTGPVAIRLQGVQVVAAGHTVLDGVDLHIQPGEHVAVVGPSGAGKSTLVGLLLGFHRPAAGVLHVDGEPLDGPALVRLRRDLVWVDPAVRLWNRSFLENLRYGSSPDAAAGPLGPAIASADLQEVLAHLPDGLQTSLGEGGGLLSGGEGQRVRLARGLHRGSPRLVILDEAFRGLDRDRRSALLARARTCWRDTTLLCVTHDIRETAGFHRVLVLDGGQVVEDGAPATLAADPTTTYAKLLAAEVRVHEGQWGGTTWRRWDLRDGQLRETPATPGPAPEARP